MRYLIVFLCLFCFSSLSYADDFNSSFAPPSGVLDGIKKQYSDRLQLFLSDVRSSPLFSIPEQIKNFSASGSSVLVINAGHFAPADSGGQINYDFSTMFGTFPFLFIRALCLSLSTFYALNHVLRGGAG